MKTLKAMRNAQTLARNTDSTLTVFRESGEIRVKKASNESHAHLGIDFDLDQNQILLGFVFACGRFEGAYC